MASTARAETMETSFGASTASIELVGDFTSSLQRTILPWVSKSAEAVMTYYGRFPVPQVRIKLITIDGDGVAGGQAFPGDVPTIRVRVGRDATETQLMQDDWVMVHEMIHLAFPWLNMKHNWMAEGIAVYVESIARVQAGHLKAPAIWSDFIDAMPKGLPKPGEGGLDQTPTWGRTYWGGALFCLLCDVQIRQKTGNKSSLQQALRTINAVRDFRKEWPFQETLEIGDLATGQTVMADTYEEMKDKAITPDLPTLWKNLGIKRLGRTVSFDDAAPLAPIRSAITKPIR